MLKLIKNSIRRRFMNSSIFISCVVDRDRVEHFFKMIKSNQRSCELIRIGGNGDGGYLVPNDLDGIAEAFSPGVSVIADFESALVARGIRCYLADYSVECPPLQHEDIDFEKKYLGVEDSEIFTRLDSWVARKQSKYSDLILQMDIEGAEYSVLLEAQDEVLSKFRIIIIEFHHLNRIFEIMGFDLIDMTFRKLLKQFDIVHMHPNNCREPIEHYGFSIPPVMEFTFLRRDRLEDECQDGVAPNILDVANVTSKPDFVLPECWRK